MSESAKKKKKKDEQRATFTRIKLEPDEEGDVETTGNISSQPRPQPLNLKKEKNESTIDRCSICWSDPPINAIRLDCSHLFCFLCIKSVAAATGRCALCRAEIDKDFDFGEFELVGEPKLPQPSADGDYWFYEGKTGWWLYDADTSKDLEEAHNDSRKYIERLISGQVYVLNLVMKKQYQKSEPSRSRKICRSKLSNLDNNLLGMAGIRDKNLVDLMKSSQRGQNSGANLAQQATRRLPTTSNNDSNNDSNNNRNSTSADEDAEDPRF